MKPRNFKKIDIFHFNLICELNELLLPSPLQRTKGKMKVKLYEQIHTCQNIMVSQSITGNKNYRTPKKKETMINPVETWRAFISRWQILFIETCNGNKVIIISEIRKITQTKFDMVPKMAKATRPFWLWLCYKQNFLTNYINQGTREQDFCNKHNRRPTRANRSDKREN